VTATNASNDIRGIALTATGADLVLKTSTFALAMADAVWDEVTAGHTTVSTTGKAIIDILGGSSAASIADAVWDEVLHTDHEVAGSASVLLQTSGAAADPLLNAVPGAYVDGTAGNALGLVTTARMGALTDWIDAGRLDALLDAVKVVTDKLGTMIEVVA
jgi:hypothetical protein